MLAYIDLQLHSLISLEAKLLLNQIMKQEFNNRAFEFTFFTWSRKLLWFVCCHLDRVTIFPLKRKMRWAATLQQKNKQMTVEFMPLMLTRLKQTSNWQYCTKCKKVLRFDFWMHPFSCRDMFFPHSISLPIGLNSQCQIACYELTVLIMH